MKTGQRNRAAMVECAYELQHYLSNARDVLVRHVHMMCPPSISGRSAWALKELESIVAYRGVNVDQHGVLYRTAVTTYKLGELDLRKKKHARILFSSRHLERHSRNAPHSLHDDVEPRLLAPFCVR
ncbi:hypothetical protein D3C76_1549170 [compost metagenome]